MASKNEFSLAAAIKRAAENIPFELMMTVAADEARKLAEHYRDAGVSETDILGALVAEVQKRRAEPAT